MPAAVVKTPRDKRLWEEAKKQAASQGRTGDYAYIMGIFMRMRDGKGGADSKTPDSTKAIAVPEMHKSDGETQPTVGGPGFSIGATQPVVPPAAAAHLTAPYSRTQKATSVEYARKATRVRMRRGDFELMKSHLSYYPTPLPGSQEPPIEDMVLMMKRNARSESEASTELGKASGIPGYLGGRVRRAEFKDDGWCAEMYFTPDEIDASDEHWLPYSFRRVWIPARFRPLFGLPPIEMEPHAPPQTH